MAMSSPAVSRFLVVNGIPHAGDVPPISAFLESLPGAYTTTRTHGNASLILFWERHLRRLANSVRILAEHRPDLFGAPASANLSAIRSLVDESLHVGLGLALAEWCRQTEVTEEMAELAVTALVCNGRGMENNTLNLYLHIGFYVPPVFGAAGARLALVGRGRDISEAKYSQWARIRKDLEKMRPPMVTELLLSNDGDRVLEGSVTNFFVVCKVKHDEADDPIFDLDKASFIVQTAPLSDGVLPGVVRQLVIEVCSSIGIPLQEVAPSWSDHELWKEAFITIGGLRLIQHVESVQVPTSGKSFLLRNWDEVSWETKRFEGIGLVTSQIQTQIIARIGAESYRVNNIL